MNITENGGKFEIKTNPTEVSKFSHMDFQFRPSVDYIASTHSPTLSTDYQAVIFNSNPPMERTYGTVIWTKVFLRVNFCFCNFPN